MESILNAKGKYIILMDPDDMFLNENLFKELYNYNININIDITEFSVFQQIEGRRKIFFPNNHFENHYHNFSKNMLMIVKDSNHIIYKKLKRIIHFYLFVFQPLIWRNILYKIY